jgi:hypothetical protein
VLKALKENEAILHRKTLKPQRIMTDFELAAISAFKNAFPDIENKSCMFHLGLSIMKHLGILGLKTIQRRQ